MKKTSITQNIINRNIWVLRNRKGISAREAAEKLNVSRNTLRAVEYSNTEPKASLLLGISELYQEPDIKKLLTELVED